jgi:hypothetical protein
VGDLKLNLGKIHQHGQRAASIVRGMLEHRARAPASGARPISTRWLTNTCALAYQGLRAKDKASTPRVQTDFAPDLPLSSAVGATWAGCC